MPKKTQAVIAKLFFDERPNAVSGLWNFFEYDHVPSSGRAVEYDGKWYEGHYQSGVGARFSVEKREGGIYVR